MCITSHIHTRLYHTLVLRLTLTNLCVSAAGNDVRLLCLEINNQILYKCNVINVSLH